MYIAELNGKPHPNLIGKFEFESNLIRKFEFESNLIVVESELKTKPCDMYYQTNSSWCSDWKQKLIKENVGY